MNSGIALFYQYDVMFDPEDGVIGFRPLSDPLPNIILNVTGRKTSGPGKSWTFLSGMASSRAGIVSVSCYNARRKHLQSLIGVRAWGFSPGVKTRENDIRIQATDAVGRIATRRLTIYGP